MGLKKYANCFKISNNYKMLMNWQLWQNDNSHNGASLIFLQLNDYFGYLQATLGF